MRPEGTAFPAARLRGQFQRLTALGALAGLLGIFSLINPNFCSAANGVNLLRQIVPILLITIAQSLVMITGNIDLSIGSCVGLSSMVMATLLSRGIVQTIPAMLISLLCCLLLGLCNGLLVALCRLPAFIVTLGTMTIARGAAQLVGGSYNTDAITKFYPAQAQQFKQIFYYGKTLGLYNGVWIALVLLLAADALLRRTRTGRWIRAAGCNPNGARLSGVDVTGTVLLVYCISAFCAFAAGLMNCAAVGQGTMDCGSGYEMYAVASAVIGGVSILGGRGSMPGAAVGAAIWGTLENGLQFAGAPVAIRNIIVGVVMLCAVLLDVMLCARQRARREEQP